MKAQQFVLASRPAGIPTAENFRLEDIELPGLNEGEVLLKPIYISVDPYMRGRMNDAKSYIPPFVLNAPINGGAVAIVEESNSTDLKKGDTVSGTLPWATQSIQQASYIKKIDTNLAPASYYLGILGMPGLTAYFGLLDICAPKAGENVVVSGAAGAVGIVVGQIAKIMGCHVVGIAGTDDKIKLLKHRFGYDEVINYKTSADVKEHIAAACPHGVDVYFDNVGGEITDAVVANLNFNARIALCGQISLYNDTEQSMGPRFLPMILTRSALVKGFIISNYTSRFPEGIKQLAQWITEGKLHYNETVLNGFEKLPEAFLGLFTGKNEGKMLVKMI